MYVYVKTSQASIRSQQKPNDIIYLSHNDAQRDTSKTPGWKDIKLLM